MGYIPTREIPEDFPNTLPDIIQINGHDIQLDLLVDSLIIDSGLTHEMAHEVLVNLLHPGWYESEND